MIATVITDTMHNIHGQGGISEMERIEGEDCVCVVSVCMYM